MAYWLLKSEPDDYCIDDLQNEPAGYTPWDGVRNYQARNILRDRIQVGDEVFIYQSNCKDVGIVGTGKVVKGAYPDPAQFDSGSKYFDARATPDSPRWYCVDVSFTRKFDQLLPLKRIKTMAPLENMVLLKQGRLSVQPVTADEWRFILSVAS